MEAIKNVLKGMVIGIANIIPGVSGGTMAVSMGIYDKLIHALTHIKSEFKKSMKLVIPIIIGAAIAIVALSFAIEYLFVHYPIPTNLLFIGLIVGGLPAIGKKVKGHKFKISYAIAFFIFFAIVVGLAMTGGQSAADREIPFNFLNVILMFVIGIIAAATMIIPGVSGSMVMMLLGYYNTIISSIKDFITSLIHFDVDGILAGMGILVPFGIGCIVGIVVIAKMIEWLFQRYPLIAYWAIIGLIVASPIAILLLSTFTYTSLILTIIASVIAFAAGFIVSMKLGGD